MSAVFLCIGAAKSGTSWLYHQLSAHPECHFRSIKELHYFDALDRGTVVKQRSQVKARQVEILERTRGGTQASVAQAARIADRGHWLDVLERGGEDLDAYLDYLRAGSAPGQVVGEMTPAYALLSAERLGRMARMAGDVKFLYVMRDPVERLWSHIRMIAARRDDQGQVTSRRCARLLDRVISGEEDQIAERSDYAGTLRRLTSAVPVRQRLFEVFEEMVQGDGFLRICEFLGIGRVRPDPVPVHQGQVLPMTSEQRRRAAHFLAPQYDAAHRALGRMPQAWGREG